MKDQSACRAVAVLKFSGRLAEDPAALQAILAQAALLKRAGCPVVLVHGGGVQIDVGLDTAGIAYAKKDGVRVTSAAALPVVAACLGTIRARLAETFSALGEEREIEICAMTAADGGLVRAVPRFPGTRTGTPTAVDTARLTALAAALGRVLLLSPLCGAADGGLLNVNADEVAAALAEALHARALAFCCPSCVLDRAGRPISHIRDTDIDALVADGTLKDGMIVKLRVCMDILKRGRVADVLIVNGRDPAALERALTGRSASATRLSLAA